MRKNEDVKSFIEECGDMLFSAAMQISDTRQGAVLLVSRAIEDYADSADLPWRAKNRNAAFRYTLKRMEKRAKRKIPAHSQPEFLRDSEKGKIIACAEIYLKKGGRRRKRIGLLITALIIAAIIASVIIYKYHYMTSEDYQGLWIGWYEKETQFREKYGWGHCLGILSQSLFSFCFFLRL